jgi:hypothetical protein
MNNYDRQRNNMDHFNNRVENSKSRTRNTLPSNNGQYSVPVSDQENDIITRVGTQNLPETLKNDSYRPAYLSNNIGRWVRVDFLIGNNLEQEVGILMEVGASYIVLKSLEPDTVIVCDMFSIKFVTIIYSDEYEKLYNR